MDLTLSEQSYTGEERKKAGLLILFLLGVIGGTLLFNYLKPQQQTKLMIYTGDLLRRIRISKGEKTQLFQYVLKYRTREILLFILMGLTPYRLLLHGLFLFVAGMRNAILICLLTAGYGVKSLGYYFLLTMPQLLIYIVLFYGLLLQLDFDTDYSRNRFRLSKMIRVVLLLLIGCLTEAVLNPGIFRWLVIAFLKE